MLQAYFDESGTHDGSPVFCMAGYLIEKTQAEQLAQAWKTVLDRFSLPYFHMVDCAHRSPPFFDKLSKDQCIEVEKEMIALIRKHVLFGTAMALSEKDYNDALPVPYNLTGSAYTYCCWTVLSIIHEWIVRNQFRGKIAYFFEAGHKHQTEANSVMNQIFFDKERRASYRYATHSFVEKQHARPIQAADILAWQHATDVKKILSSQKRRADFNALIEGQPLMLRHIRREQFDGMRRQIMALLSGRHQNLISGTFGEYSFVSVPLENEVEGPSATRDA